MKTSGIIVAAGRGTRMGGVDKCALCIAGRSLVSFTVAALGSVVDTLVVVVAADQLNAWRERSAAEGWQGVHALVAGGADRNGSVRAGFDALRAVAPATAIVAIHDGARPLVTPDLARRCIAAADETGAAICATPVTDTIKRVAAMRVAETLDRTTLWAAQTPQCFRRSLLDAAFAWAAETNRGEFTDEARMIEAYGQPVAVVPGEPTNLKVTTPGDLVVAEALLRARAAVAQ